MSKALFITTKDLKQRSIISGNVDPDKIVQFIEVAQDTHIQNYLGGKLYKKIQVFNVLILKARRLISLLHCCFQQ